MKASIIVPVYNVSDFLFQTLCAITNQIQNDIEVILIDDGSLDDSHVICCDVARSYSNILVYSQLNSGVSASRNVGLMNAKGEYVLFCDADDIPSVNWVKVLINTCEQLSTDVTYGAFRKQQGDHFILNQIDESVHLFLDNKNICQLLSLSMSVWNFPYFEIKNFFGTVWRSAYRRTFIIKNSILFPTDISLGEDLLFNLSFLRRRPKISFTSEYVYTYIENRQSATHNNLNIIWLRYKKLWSKVKMELLRQSISLEYLKWYNYQLRNYMVNAIIEGVVNSNSSVFSKCFRISRILSDEDWKSVRDNLPKNWKIQMEKVLLRPISSPLILIYMLIKVHQR